MALKSQAAHPVVRRIASFTCDEMARKSLPSPAVISWQPRPSIEWLSDGNRSADVVAGPLADSCGERVLGPINLNKVSPPSSLCIVQFLILAHCFSTLRAFDCHRSLVSCHRLLTKLRRLSKRYTLWFIVTIHYLYNGMVPL